MRVVRTPEGQALAVPSNREREVLRELCTGAPYKVIAWRLGMSMSAVKGHLASLTGELGMNRTQLAIWAANNPEVFEDDTAVPIARVELVA